MSCRLRTVFVCMWSFYAVITICPCAGSKIVNAFKSSVLGKDVTQNQEHIDSKTTLFPEEHPSHTKKYSAVLKSGSIYAEGNENRFINSNFRPLRFAETSVLLEPVDVSENYNSAKITDVTARSPPNSFAGRHPIFEVDRTEDVDASLQNSEEILKINRENSMNSVAESEVDSTEPVERTEPPRELFETDERPLFTNASHLEPKESVDDSDFDSSQYEAAYLSAGDDYGDDVEVVDQLLVRPPNPRSIRKKPDSARKRDFRGPKPRSNVKNKPVRKDNANVRNKHNGSYNNNNNNNNKEQTYRKYVAGKTKFENQTNLKRRKGIVEDGSGQGGGGRRVERGVVGKITNKDKYRLSNSNTANVPDDQTLTESRIPDHRIVSLQDQSPVDYYTKKKTGESRARRPRAPIIRGLGLISQHTSNSLNSNPGPFETGFSSGVRTDFYPDNGVHFQGSGYERPLKETSV